eukprot:7219810-Alexandrium_andersonii.AAC.1
MARLMAGKKFSVSTACSGIGTPELAGAIIMANLNKAPVSTSQHAHSTTVAHARKSNAAGPPG